MAKKGSLFQLVKSLSKTEKRHFKLNQPHSGANNYMQLFDFVDQQENQNNQAIKDHFQGANFTRQLHVAKNYLTSQILKSLRTYHAGSSVNIKITEWLGEIEILYKKELYNQAGDIIKKAKAKAVKYERFNLLLEVLSWERKLLIAQLGSGHAAAHIQKLLDDEAQVLKQLTNLNAYLQITYKVFGGAFDSAFFNQFNNNPLLQSEDQALSFSALNLYYHLKYVLTTFGGNPDAGLEYISQLIEAYEARAYLIKENPDGYVTALNNKMSAFVHLRRTDEALEFLYKIRAVPDQFDLKQDNYMIKVFLKTYNVELELYRDTKNWDRGLELIEEIKSFLSNNMKVVGEAYLISFYFQFAYIFFKTKNYSQALHAANFIVDKPSQKERTDLQIFARLLLLMIHYELGNITVLKYIVEATRRYLKKVRASMKFEKRLLKFFAKLSTMAVSQHKSLFQEEKEKLFLGLSAAEKTHILDFVDFESWLIEKS